MKLCLPDGKNKTDVGQLSDMKLWLPDGENKTGIARTAEQHKAMLTRRREYNRARIELKKQLIVLIPTL